MPGTPQDATVIPSKRALIGFILPSLPLSTIRWQCPEALKAKNALPT